MAKLKNSVTHRWRCYCHWCVRRYITLHYIIKLFIVAKVNKKLSHRRETALQGAL